MRDSDGVGQGAAGRGEYVGGDGVGDDSAGWQIYRVAEVGGNSPARAVASRTAAGYTGPGPIGELGRNGVTDKGASNVRGTVVGGDNGVGQRAAGQIEGYPVVFGYREVCLGVGRIDVAVRIIVGRRVGDASRQGDRDGIGQSAAGRGAHLGSDRVGDDPTNRQVHRIAEVSTAAIGVTAAGAAAGAGADPGPRSDLGRDGIAHRAAGRVAGSAVGDGDGIGQRAAGDIAGHPVIFGRREIGLGGGGIGVCGGVVSGRWVSDARWRGDGDGVGQGSGGGRVSLGADGVGDNPASQQINRIRKSGWVGAVAVTAAGAAAARAGPRPGRDFRRPGVVHHDVQGISVAHVADHNGVGDD